MHRGYKLAALVLGTLLMVELIVCGVLVARQWARPAPPSVDWSRVDALTAADLQAAQDRAAHGDSEQWLELADGLLAFGYLPEAEQAYARAHELADESDRPAIAYLWAACLGRIGRIEDGIERYREALAGEDAYLQQLHGEIWYRMGRFYRRLEDAPRAEAAFRESGLPKARLQLAFVLTQTGRPAEAEPLVAEVLDAMPRELEPLRLMYRLALLRGHEEAMAEAHDRLERSTHTLSFLNNPAPMFRTQERFGVARLEAAATRALEAGRREQAVTLLHEAMGHEWREALVDALARAEIQRGRPREAVALLEELIERTGGTPRAMRRLAEAHRHLGAPSSARHWLERSVALRPTRQAYEALAALAQGRNDRPTEQRYTARAMHMAGIEHFRDDQIEEARTYFHRAVDIEPDLAHAWFYLGEVKRLTDRTDAAREAYERCLTLDPAHGRAAASLSRLESHRANAGDTAR